MSPPRFLADQDFNENILRGVLRLEPAVEFLTLRAVGLEAASDMEVLAYAAAENWLVVSHDVNTMSAAAHARLADGQPLNGLLPIHQLAPLGIVINNLVLIWSASTADEWVSQVCFLPL
jgi:hypothetical protein